MVCEQQGLQHTKLALAGLDSGSLDLIPCSRPQPARLPPAWESKQQWLGRTCEDAIGVEDNFDRATFWAPLPLRLLRLRHVAACGARQQGQ